MSIIVCSAIGPRNIILKTPINLYENVICSKNNRLPINFIHYDIIGTTMLWLTRTVDYDVTRRTIAIN